MPRTTNCRCGKTLLVSTEQPNTGLVCPDCGETLTIPKRRPGRKHQPDAWECACGRAYSARSRDAGLAFKCGCGLVLSIPEESSSEVGHNGSDVAACVAACADVGRDNLGDVRTGVPVVPQSVARERAPEGEAKTAKTLQEEAQPNLTASPAPMARRHRNRQPRSVPEMAKRVKVLIKAVAFLLPMFFFGLKFQGVDLIRIGQHVGADLLLKFSLAAYFLSWCVGTTWETEDAAKLYTKAPNEGHVPLGAFVAIGLLAGMCALLYVMDSLKWFAALLAGLWIVNIGTWVYLVRTVKPSVEKSASDYQERGEYDQLEKLRVFQHLNQGDWHKWRFGIGLAILCVINFLAHAPLPQSFLPQAFGDLSPDFVIGLAIISFLGVVEGWIWFARVRARNCYALIEELAEKYDFTRENDGEPRGRLEEVRL